MDPGVAVAVGNVERPLGVEGYVRWIVKRGAAVRHLPVVEIRHAGVAVLAAGPERHQEFAAGGVFLDRVIAVVAQVQRVVRTDMQPVRPVESSFPPGAQELPVAVEDDHGMLAAVVDVDISLGI